EHPGVAHYLIHAYDYPSIAQRGLPAARRYAGLAPSSAHARHMPSHVFTRVGAWQESIDMNKSSADVADPPNRHHALERRRWNDAATLTLPATELEWSKFPHAEALVIFARGLGAARSGNVATA